MSIITMLNMKGGVGKTTSTINIGANLKSKGYKVLLVDLDAQSNLTQGLGISDELEKTIYTTFRKEHKPEDAIVSVDGIDVLPSCIDLAVLDQELTSKTLREFILQGILEPLKSKYDFILLDCPPSLGLVTVNAITASDYYLIPLQAEFFSVKGLTKLTDAVDFIKSETRTKIKLLGVFLTRFNSQKTLSRNVQEVAKENLGDIVFEAFIRENIAVSEAQAEGIDISTYSRNHKINSNASVDYMTLTDQLLKRLN